MLKAPFFLALFYIFKSNYFNLKSYVFILLFILGMTISCHSTKSLSQNKNKTILTSDTLSIANEELDYEIIIIDPGFSSWFNTNSRPRSYYSLPFLEARNRVWVAEWNSRVNSASFTNQNSLYEMSIDYNNFTNYGFEVNYMLYNYLVYFQLNYNQRLGVFNARM